MQKFDQLINFYNHFKSFFVIAINNLKYFLP